MSGNPEDSEEVDFYLLPVNPDDLVTLLTSCYDARELYCILQGLHGALNLLDGSRATHKNEVN